MPRYDDRHWNTRVYVGRLSSRTRSRDLHDLFSRYGRGEVSHPSVLDIHDGLTVSGNRFRRVRAVDMKHDFAFVEFSDPRDADDACYRLNGRNFDGSRIIVEFAKGGPRGSGSREYLGRGPPPGSGRCFNCGIDGHWARDCKSGDWKNRCYRCGERGHIERNCPNSPRSLRHGRTYSRSLSRSPSPRRGRSPSRSFSRSPGRSYSRSRSPAPRRERSIEREGKRSRSLSYSRSPEARSSPPPRGRKRSPSPTGSMSPRERSSSPSRGGKRSPYSNGSVSPREDRDGSPPREDRDGSPPRERNGSDYGRSPRMENGSGSPMSPGGCPPGLQQSRSPETNGRDGRDESPGEGDPDVGASPRVGELPQGPEGMPLD